MIFHAKNRVRMHDTDMAGILYFPRQFRFIHDAWEDLMETEGLDFHKMIYEENFLFVVAHAEADYLAPLKVGDYLDVKVTCEKIGTTSFTMKYEIFKPDGLMVGRGKTVHVTLQADTRTKIPIPPQLKSRLENYN